MKDLTSQATAKYKDNAQQNRKATILSGKKNKTDLVRALAANKQGRCQSKAIGYWRQLDVFGEQVHFTFKGKRSYQTSLGAFFSFIIKLIMVCFIAYEVYLIFARKDPLVSVKYRQNNLIDDPGELLPWQLGFDMAIGLSTVNYALLGN